MPNRVVGVDQNFDLPPSVYNALLAKLSIDFHGTEWVDLTLPTGVSTSSINPAKYRLTGIGPDRKVEFRGQLNIDSAGITTLATMPGIANESVLGQQVPLYGVLTYNSSNITIRVGRTTGLTLLSAQSVGISISLDGMHIYV